MTTRNQQQEESIRDVAFNLRGIPLPLRNKFKAVCADKGLTMQAVMISLMERYVLDKEVRQLIDQSSGA